MPGSYSAIYDFELLPYALGDVLTWNVQTAIRCEEAGRESVDIHICADERFPASVYQRHHVTPANYGLLLSELLGAFGTHPRLGNLFVYHRREDLLERLRGQRNAALAEYEKALALRADEDAAIAYFTRSLHSHQPINEYAARHGRIPLLRASPGCAPDVAGLLATRLAGKRVVAMHVRLRRLDAGYGGRHTYDRDSDFLEWYEFLREAGTRYPDVHFVALGRLQEKPLELLKLPNVSSLRPLGLGLGHELTLMLHGDLFIGTSSGFAAMANFSQAPYFITHVTAQSCKAYGIEHGAERLPFAGERQRLIYEPETRDLLMRLLERGLAGAPPRSGPRAPSPDPAIDLGSWEGERARWLYPDATTYRFFDDDAFAAKETAYLLAPALRRARAALRAGSPEAAGAIVARIEGNFAETCGRFPEFLALKRRIATSQDDTQGARQCGVMLAKLERGALSSRLRRYALHAYPWLARFRWAWQRKHRIPRKLASLILRRA